MCRLDLFEKVLLAPRQVSGDMADNDEPRSSLLGNADRLGNAFPRRHSTDDDEEIFRLVVKRDLVQIDGVINDRERFVSQHFPLSLADTDRQAMREVFSIIFVQFLLDISVSDQGGRFHES